MKLAAKLFHKQQNFALITTIISIVILQYFLQISESDQLIFLLLTAGIIGIPHGLTDFFTIKNMAKSWNMRLLIVLTYSTIVAVFFYYWDFAAFFFFTIFLILSCWHFGLQDIQANAISNKYIFIQGSLAILFPVIFHEETHIYFNLLLDNQIFFEFSEFTKLILGLIILTILLYILLQKDLSISYKFELLTLATLFYKISPIIAFSIYFTIWHTARHYIAVYSKQLEATQILMLKINIIGSLLLFLIAVTLIIFFGVRQNIDFATTGILFFKLLASLTIAHVLLSLVDMYYFAKTLKESLV